MTDDLPACRECGRPVGPWRPDAFCTSVCATLGKRAAVERARIADDLEAIARRRRPAPPKPDAPFMYHYFMAAADRVRQGE